MHVLAERRDDQLVVVLDLVDLGDHSAEPWLGYLVVSAVHEQDRADPERRQLSLVCSDATDECLGVIGDRRPVAVPDDEVFRPHG